jgi:hypothetical protein
VEVQLELVEALKQLATGKEKPINPTQKTFGAGINEDVDGWLNSINLNMEAADVPEDKKAIVAAEYPTILRVDLDE